MQSWGTQSRFTVRDTGREPSKSAVIGLLCAALGIDREDDEALAPLVAMRMGVRVDRPGVMLQDFHTAGGGTIRGEDYGVALASGKGKRTVVSHRYYLSDASFLVGLQSDDEELLRRCDAALRSPHWPPSLGRRSFVPGLPVAVPDSIRAGGLREALASEPLRVRPREKQPDGLRLVLETDDTDAEVRQDQPISLRNGGRSFGLRYVTDAWLDVADLQIEEVAPCT